MTEILDESYLTPDTVASPFLPGTRLQYAWDSTSLGLIKTCPRKYQYVILEGWQRRDESIHLRFGIEYHQALQEYDCSIANGVRHEDAIHDVVRALLDRTWDWVVDRETKVGKYKNRDTLVGLVVDYLDRFGPEDPAETYIKADGTPAVELSFRLELDWGPEPVVVDYVPTDRGNLEIESVSQPYLLCGHLDRVVTYNGALMVMDHKTSTKSLGPYYFNQWEPNNQMTLYTLAGQVVMHAPVKGVVISAAQILLTEPNKFVRGFTYRTPDQISEWLESLRVTLAEAESYAVNDFWPMNDTSCDKYGGCEFREICSHDPGVRERFLKSEFNQLAPEDRWNPLKSR